MRILLADKLTRSALEILVSAGFEVRSDPLLNGDSLRDALSEWTPDVLIVRSTKVTEAMLGASARLGLIVRAGAGTNTIAVSEAAARGIYVANCPGKNAAAVAELAFGLMLAADRQIPNGTRDLRNGVWAKNKYSTASGLKGRTLGLLGLGSVGREMVARAKAFGMPVVAWSRSLTPERADELGISRAEDPLAVALGADVLSVHVAMTPDTVGLINRAFVEAMQPGAILINTARGGIVDEEALAWGLENRDLRVGLDVFASEPRSGEKRFANALANHERVVGTHHIGASTTQAQEAVALEAVRVVKSYRDEGDVPNCVNLCELSPATHLLIVRHLNEVGVLAGVFGLLREAEFNVQETQNIIFKGAKAAVARIRVDHAPDADLIGKMGAAPGVLALSVVEL